MQNNDYKQSAIYGLSFAISWSILYTLCSIAYWASPDFMLAVTRDLFHGMSFGQMVTTGTTFTFGTYASALGLGAVYTFFAGYLVSIVRSFLRSRFSKNANEFITPTNFKVKAQAC